MTDDINMFEFLIRQKPVCSQSPIKSALGPDLHRDLRAKYKLELGIDLLADRCDNAFNCILSGSGCLGRPFPLDDSIKSALSTLNVKVTTGLHKGRPVYFAKAIVLCDECPFKSSCEAICPTQDSYINRSTKPESNPPESKLVPYEDYERGMYKALTPDDVQHCSYGDWVNESLPLDCLTPKQRQVVEMTLYEGLEQSVIAHKLNIGIPRVSLHLKRGLARLEEFGKARRVIYSKGAPYRIVNYYIHNMTQQEIAYGEGVDQSVIARSIHKWYTSKVV